MNTNQKKIIYLNSRSRTSGTHSDMAYAIDLKQLSSVDHVVVLQANIPKSYYMVQSGYNTFTLSENGTAVTVQIPIGNYNRSNFKTTLQGIINSMSPNNWTYTVSVPVSSGADTGKYTFSVSGNSSIQPQFIFSQTNNVYELMGFDIGSTNAFTADTLPSSNVIKLQKEDTVYICSDICGNHTGSILQEIYTVESADFDNIVFVNYNSDMYSKQISHAGSNTYRFWLTNEDGMILDLNGQNWTMTLGIYKRDDYNDLSREVLKRQLKTLVSK